MLFPELTREELLRSAGNADHTFAALGGLSSFPFSALKHIARAASLMTRDPSVRADLEAHVARGEARPLAELVERLGREGRLGEGWSVEAFYREASLKKLEPRREGRARRAPRRTASALLVGAAGRLGAEVARRFESLERVRPFIGRTVDVETAVAREPLARLGEELATLNALVVLAAEAPAVGAPTWRKLAGLAGLRRALARALEAETAELDDEALKRRPVVWRSLKEAAAE